ncbi:YHYH protein [Flexithrix dorotheae]|uniref:YHYH protein n=1 Tax=Flexithrix dorotheae TaxID=70993 RepID=UPI00036F9CB2|nr:YHYH protein [Flexithrix dorotheae]
MNYTKSALIGIIFFFFAACSEDNGNVQPNDPTEPEAELPAVYKNFSNEVEVYIDGEFIVLESSNLPDHKSPYYDEKSDMYEDYQGTNSKFQLNPNRISEQKLVVKVPLNPKKATKNEATGLGAIGISTNGIAIFNQYAGPDQPLTNEINSFDHYNGHPAQQGVYHYHIEPLYLTSKNGKESFLGVLLDGFPVYGPMENGKKITNADLDEFHGHSSATADYPEGIYHYHITDEDPYINGSGYYGTPGTATN